MTNSKYMYIGIEISTVCNAQCPWCFTTRTYEKSKHLEQNSGFMDIERFISIIDRLEELDFINPDVVLNLYEIGEPFLNKDLTKIFNHLNEGSIKYAISTNGSAVKTFEKGTNALKNLSNLIISMPGFSQESYDKVHGFQFEKIKNNIVKLVTNFRECGFTGDARIVYHVYQFNLDEIEIAKKWADQNDIDFYSYYAILYEWAHVQDFLAGKLPYELLNKASQELFLGIIHKTLSARPSDFTCEFFNMLLIDLNGNLKTCCQIREGDPGYSYGNLFDLSTKEIIQKRTSQRICDQCQARNMDYYLSVYTPFSLGFGDAKQNHSNRDLDNLLKTKNGREIILFGAGKFGLTALKYLKGKTDNTILFSDNSPLKVGKQIQGISVINPSEIPNLCDNPLVIVTTINHKQIKEQLSRLGIEQSYYFPIETYSKS